MYWNVPELNDGAGGKYIFAYQSKHTSYGAVIKEVAVVASNYPIVTPPFGWQFVQDWNGSGYYHDLNEGAGGDYIYLLYKR